MMILKSKGRSKREMDTLNKALRVDRRKPQQKVTPSAAISAGRRRRLPGGALSWSGGGGRGDRRNGHIERGRHGPQKLGLLCKEDAVSAHDVRRRHEQALLDRAARAGELVERGVELDEAGIGLGKKGDPSL